MSSSGQKILQYNPLERALSTDQNRAQSFSGAMLAELMRALFDTGQGSDDVQAGAACIPSSGTGTPPSAEVLSGFLLAPTNGGVGCTVGSGTPNVLIMYDPDTIPNPDDSQEKMIVDDPGTSALALTGNSSGSIRIDVLECSRVQPDAVLETDNRDVFNTITGTFTPTTINKVTAAQLQYRIRQGTPAGGFPGIVSDWLPLYVMSVPTGTTTWDTVTIWDVRPLINDRVRNLGRVSIDLPRLDPGNFYTFRNVSSTFIMTGIAETTYEHRRIGGRIQRGSPGSQILSPQPGVDFNDTANREASMSTANGLKYIYLLKPFSLPRWARFSDAAAGPRTPGSPRGILLMSVTPPNDLYGTPSSPITFPTVFGFGAGGFTSSGVCVATVVYNGGLQNQTCSNNKVATWYSTIPPIITGAFTSTLVATYSLVEGVNIPPSVKRVHLFFRFSLATSTAGGLFDPQVVVFLASDPSMGAALGTAYLSPTPLDASTDLVGFSGWVELPNAYPSVLTQTYTVVVDFDHGGFGGGSTASTGNPSMYVLGWEL
jgi:hypothetical protein